MVPQGISSHTFLVARLFKPYVVQEGNELSKEVKGGIMRVLESEREGKEREDEKEREKG